MIDCHFISGPLATEIYLVDGNVYHCHVQMLFFDRQIIELNNCNQMDPPVNVCCVHLRISTATYLLWAYRHSTPYHNPPARTFVSFLSVSLSPLDFAIPTAKIDPLSLLTTCIFYLCSTSSKPTSLTSHGGGNINPLPFLQL